MMMRHSILIAAALAAPLSAQSDFGNPALTQTPITTQELNHPYVVHNLRMSRERVLADLRRVCSSERRADQRRCANAWAILTKKYAEFQAAKAQAD